MNAKHIQAQANAMMKAAEEFKSCKRNRSSGSINENSRHAVKTRLVAALLEIEIPRADAWKMAHDLGNALAR